MLRSNKESCRKSKLTETYHESCFFWTNPFRHVPALTSYSIRLGVPASRSFVTVCAQPFVLPHTQQNLPDAFLIDNEMTGDPSIIGDKFNNIFANMGRRLSEQLTTPDNVNFKDYLWIPVVPNMSFSQISDGAVMEVLNNLKQKLSYTMVFHQDCWRQVKM